MPTRSVRLAGAALVAGLGLATIAACGSGDDSSGSSSSGGGDSAKKIAFLLPESKTTRYETFDRPLFEAAVKKDCAACEIIYSNADQDASKQQQQAEAALTQGANVLVLDPVDGKAAAAIAASAKGQGVPVVAYDRFIAGVDYYVSFDNESVGKLQAQTLVDILKKDGKTSGDIVMINGSPTDPNAASFKKGAHSVIDTSGFKVAAEYDTPDWSPDKAQAWMEGQISAVKGNLVGVYAANDGTGGGAIAALKGGGVNPLPPVTGQDSELAAIQRILSGDQAMTIYKPIPPEAEAAAKAAIALANKQKPASTADTEGVPSTILDPIAVTKDTIKDTIIKDNVYKVADICTGSFAAACTAAGIS
ncbi:sugar ABC transporter substrate-binding protein [Pedococcus aerophilus]|uniref:Sugar ABC transporter substrate-binding protein n=1 Tax=Pedococcus aerophilus TaxID=436356 RepID=A0ABP6H7Y9_9MICO